MSGKRLALFDNAKFALIMFVVIGHFADYYTSDHTSMRSLFLFIYSFHMPLFIFISGLFVKEMAADSRLDLNKVLSFVAIGFLMKALGGVLTLISDGWVPFSLLADGGPAWFMFALAAYSIFVWVLRGVRQGYVLVFSVVLALFVGYDSTVGDFLYLSRIIVFFPFFWIGYCLVPGDIAKFVTRKQVKIAAVCVVAAVLLLCLFFISEAYGMRGFFTGRNSYDSIGVDHAFVFRLLAYVVSAAMCVSILALTPSGRVPLVSEFGSRTLQVYVWHGSALTLLQLVGTQSICDSLFGSFGFLAFVALAVPVTFLLSFKPFGAPLKPFLKLGRS